MNTTAALPDAVFRRVKAVAVTGRETPDHHTGLAASPMLRTSTTDPLRIDEVAVPGTRGLIGLTICPGKQQADGVSGHWQRDLDVDLAAIAAWGASLILNLVEDHEMRALGVADTARRLPAGIAYLRLPIRDAGLPDEAWEREWALTSPGLHARLQAGERLVVHCKGGLGRTGLVAARLLVERGTPPAEAVAMVRAARPGAIETVEQYRYVLALAPGSLTP